MDRETLTAENERRKALLHVAYDPETGRGCAGRRVWSARFGAFLPDTMVADPDFTPGIDRIAYERLRCRHDFEYWAVRCVTIRHKLTGLDVPLRLNAPQRRVAAMLEDDRRAGRPLRLIMLKARQWGGSTLVQMYMAWIQSVHRHNWNSLICAHVKDTAATIRGMYNKVLSEYPRELWEGDGGPELRPYEGSVNTRVIVGRGCRVTVASAENHDAVRGQDISMAHLSEVAFWKETERQSGSDFLRAVCGGIPLEPYTFIAVESTANGVGGTFHDLWLRAEGAQSGYRPVFVPWYEIEMYRMEVTDVMEVWNEMDEYERRLWDSGRVTLEMLRWYRCKRREVPDDAAMHAEYPSDPIEAFVSTGRGVFDREAVARLRSGCSDPVAVGEVAGSTAKGRGALSDVAFHPAPDGRLKIWHYPVPLPDKLRQRYLVTVDIGGRTAKADWSVIAVIERRVDAPPRIVAQWRGHIDHDLLGWKAAAIARYYNEALLIIESNTLECCADGDSQYILEEINMSYPRLYYREVRDMARRTVERHAGFHTNRATKTLVITSLIAMVRDGDYVEADVEACNELDSYEHTPAGGYAARIGHHDDILMTRAIGLYVASTMRIDTDDSLSRLMGIPC